MKHLYLCLLFCFSLSTMYGQDIGPASEGEVYNLAGVDVKPEFPGGMQEFYNYIGKSYRVPNVKGLSGKVFVSFIVDIDGYIKDIKVLRDVGHGTGKEAVRILSESPQWSPGEQNGRKVKCLYSLPINITPQR
ncbi:energy transducer TonB [Flavobacterium sp.]|uniref:energy transducer TonB n=1 Tax=Flavobacterium sp. TaxID=239 RepID=UPI0039E3EC1C